MRPVDAQRWSEIFSTFDELVELDATSRAERLASIGASDPELRSGIEALMAADSNVESCLERVELTFRSPISGHKTASGPADPLRLAGRAIAHFRVLEPLAHGGMGVVYRAEDLRLTRFVALKFPLPAQHVDQAAKERFLREARAAGALDHPNLCTVHETGETEDGYLFIAMPLYDGETLKARIEREGALPISDALSIAQQVANGLNAAHAAGIVHRDLKPANLMLLRDGSVKILDFGLAKATDLSLTQSHARLGTVSYMSPEQIRGEPLNGRSDLWSLGVLLYEMVTGCRPFDGEHDAAITHAIVHNEPVPLDIRRRDVAAGIAEVVNRLLAKEATDRYQSAADVAADVSVLQAGQAISTRFVRSGVRPRAHRRVTPARAAAALALLLAGTWGAWQLLREPSATSVHTLAVLPFNGRASAEDDRYLANGFADAIRTELARQPNINTAGATTALAYDANGKEPAQLARELGVSALLRGGVQRTNEHVHLTLELLDGSSGRTLWSHSYDRPLTELPRIERLATQAVLAALRIGLTPGQRARLDSLRTSNSKAYELYLRGREAELAAVPRLFTDSFSIENIRRAQSLYSRARQLDPGFAFVRARLAIVHMYAALLYDTTSARSEQARLEAENALRLHAGLPEAHEALSMYWLRLGDVPKAVEELNRAIAAAPNDASLRAIRGNVYVRVGRFEDGLADLERAMQLDPGNPDHAFRAAVYYLRVRRDSAAMAAFDRATALAPDLHMVRVIKGHTYLRAYGIPDSLQAIMRRIPLEWDPDGMATWARYSVLRVQRRYREALAMLDAARVELSRDGLVYYPMSLTRAEVHEALGERDKARSYYERARKVLTDSLAVHSNDASIRSALALANAGLGRKADAAREARRAMELSSLTKVNPAATAFMGIAVEVFGRIGDLDAAFELLELLLAMPAGREVNVAWLRISPGFDPLRKDPRFAELLARFSDTTAPRAAVYSPPAAPSAR